jgi:beta-1,4-mannosyl-glycoprotein beta-1,4-N-acetylglucosaminyltransferase
MIYDCFPFFNELDLLEIRLNELDSVVDRFVLVEARHTFQNKPKTLYFDEHKQHYEKFLHKIDHIVIDHFPKFYFKKFRFTRPWDRSNMQKNAVALGLKNCKPDDIILISDLDEIPCADLVRKYASIPGVKAFEQILTNYFINCIMVECPNSVNIVKRNGLVYWKGTVMISYRDFKNYKTTRLMHDITDGSILAIENGGWHYSYIGQAADLLIKLHAFEHANEEKFKIHELNTDIIKEKIATGNGLFGTETRFELMDVSSEYPEYVKQNIDKFKHMIG